MSAAAARLGRGRGGSGWSRWLRFRSRCRSRRALRLVEGESEVVPSPDKRCHPSRCADEGPDADATATADADADADADVGGDRGVAAPGAAVAVLPDIARVVDNTPRDVFSACRVRATRADCAFAATRRRCFSRFACRCNRAMRATMELASASAAAAAAVTSASASSSASAPATAPAPAPFVVVVAAVVGFLVGEPPPRPDS